MAKTILIVEDNERNMRLIRDILSANQYDVITAENGEQGVLKALENKPDLILMDIQMPVMDGLSATKIIKENKETRDIPVVALTSSAMRQDRAKIMTYGFSEYLTKPFGVKDFLGRISTLLKKG